MKIWNDIRAEYQNYFGSGISMFWSGVKIFYLLKVRNNGIRCDGGRWKFTGYIFSKYTLSKHLSNLFDYRHYSRFFTIQKMSGSYIYFTPKKGLTSCLLWGEDHVGITPLQNHFFIRLKTQLIYHIRLYNFREAEKILFRYIEIYYNHRKRYSINGWKTPSHCEQELYNLKKVA